jgi:hypothetical protein
MGVGFPRWLITFVRLVAPNGPFGPNAAREHFEKRAAAAILDQLVLLIRLARMLALARPNVVQFT